jgi:hypothetical protein
VPERPLFAGRQARYESGAPVFALDAISRMLSTRTLDYENIGAQRLSFAAQFLANGARDMPDLASASGHGISRGFLHAFRTQIGVTFLTGLAGDRVPGASPRAVTCLVAAGTASSHRCAPLALLVRQMNEAIWGELRQTAKKATTAAEPT